LANYSAFSVGMGGGSALSLFNGAFDSSVGHNHNPAQSGNGAKIPGIAISGAVGSATTATTATNVTANINGQAISTIFEVDGTTVKNATTATNVNANINGHAITDIFDTDGITPKSIKTSYSASDTVIDEYLTERSISEATDFLLVTKLKISVAGNYKITFDLKSESGAAFAALSAYWHVRSDLTASNMSLLANNLLINETVSNQATYTEKTVDLWIPPGIIYFILTSSFGNGYVRNLRIKGTSSSQSVPSYF
jgi:hypothetical protein